MAARHPVHPRSPSAADRRAVVRHLGGMTGHRPVPGPTRAAGRRRVADCRPAADPSPAAARPAADQPSRAVDRPADRPPAAAPTRVADRWSTAGPRSAAGPTRVARHRAPAARRTTRARPAAAAESTPVPNPRADRIGRTATPRAAAAARRAWTTSVTKSASLPRRVAARSRRRWGSRRPTAAARPRMAWRVHPAAMSRSGVSGSPPWGWPDRWRATVAAAWKRSRTTSWAGPPGRQRCPRPRLAGWAPASHSEGRTLRRRAGSRHSWCSRPRSLSPMCQATA